MRTEIDLDESEIDLNKSAIDLTVNWCEHFLKANQFDLSFAPSWINVSVNGVLTLFFNSIAEFAKSTYPEVFRLQLVLTYWRYKTNHGITRTL